MNFADVLHSLTVYLKLKLTHPLKIVNSEILDKIMV